jgi:hypothetical protein
MVLAMSGYPAFFEAVTGQPPLPWQRRLGEGPWPDVVRVPTGLGKTAGVVEWFCGAVAVNIHTQRSTPYHRRPRDRPTCRASHATPRSVGRAGLARTWCQANSCEPASLKMWRDRGPPLLLNKFRAVEGGLFGWTERRQRFAAV